MTKLYAQPYSTEHTGFYFDNMEEFKNDMDRLKRRGCEEVEIQFIDGDDYLAELASATQIEQDHLALWFEELENLDKTAATQLTFLLNDVGYSLPDALERYEEVCIYEGTAPDYAYDLLDGCYDIPEYLRMYIDYDAIAHDMKINGDITEISSILIVTNANEF